MESNNLAENENEAFKNIVQSICKVFPGEQPPTGLSIHDSTVSISLLMCFPLFYYSCINNNEYLNSKI